MTILFDCNSNTINTNHTRLGSLLIEIMDTFENTTIQFAMNHIKTLIDRTLELRNINISLKTNVLQEFDDSDEDPSFDLFANDSWE